MGKQQDKEDGKASQLIHVLEQAGHHSGVLLSSLIDCLLLLPGILFLLPLGILNLLLSFLFMQILKVVEYVCDANHGLYHIGAAGSTVVNEGIRRSASYPKSGGWQTVDRVAVD